MWQIKLIVKTDAQKYPIIIGKNLISRISAIFKNNSIRFNNCLIIVDKKVPKKFLKKIQSSFKKEKLYLNILLQENK